MTTPRERPLNCTALEVRAFLAGAKTQLRRPIIPQLAVPKERPLKHARTHLGPYFDSYCGERKTEQNPRGMSDRWCWWTADDRPILPEIRCPFGMPGDRLRVREAFGLHAHGDETDWYRGSIRGVTSDALLAQWRMAFRADWGPLQEECYWRSPILMPRWASRITLEIVNVRVQRVQEISGKDAIAEGTDLDGMEGRSRHDCPTPVERYSKLWDSTNGKRLPSSNNPWVWAATMRMLDQRAP